MPVPSSYSECFVLILPRMPRCSPYPECPGALLTQNTLVSLFTQNALVLPLPRIPWPSPLTPIPFSSKLLRGAVRHEEDSQNSANFDVSGCNLLLWEDQIISIRSRDAPRKSSFPRESSGQRQSQHMLTVAGPCVLPSRSKQIFKSPSFTVWRPHWILVLQT